ncbi:amino acid adenylation domain-containing protein [Actinocorallia sp. API 0066]|uniref:non-ribosomal peptide synthetase n=1 Tax=Actinocorallia sp. API 0066 TaxID=2896846 RepID=UPI001E4871DA|nr:non-ribosomal peptide synthetase [Actinocorallia sp. API 0066]MCD0447744.1 amino acid adenylation domain-containing protein [Actinocorallia sp. API 0066]
MSEVKVERIARLSPERQALLARLRRDGRRVARRADGGPQPLSHAQRRLWFVNEMGEGGTAFSAPVTYRVRGRIDADVLDRALRFLIGRHPSLRTVFPEHDGEPVQVTGEVPEQAVRRVRLGHLPPEAREAAAWAELRAEVATPFDLGQGPPLRTVLVTLADDDHFLLLNIHHITSDQWSMGILARELEAVYTALGEGRAPELPPLPIDYADYALWQRDRLTGAAERELLAYWERRLDGMVELDLPADRQRPPVPSYRGAEDVVWLPPELVTGLRRVAAETKASPFLVLLAAFAALLSRYTGEDDIAVGTTAAGRDAPEADGLIGFFVNTLVLRTDTGGDPTFRELVGRVGKGVLADQAHAELPFDRLVEHLRPSRDPGRPPLASILFQQDNTPAAALSLPGLDVALVDDFDTGTAKYDLLASVRVRDEGVRLHVQYSLDLFEPATIRRFLTAFEALAEAAVADPDTPVRALPVLPPDEAALILDHWNDTAVEFPDVCLHELFDRQPRDAVALVAGGERFTFGELDERSDRLAAHLGAAPGTLVALTLPPGPDYLVAVLAVLKSGAAFVPIDPAYPESRIEYILADSGVAVVVTAEDVAASASVPPSRPSVAVSPEDRCYVIYTSGSTGAPKGVVLRHRGVVNNLFDLNVGFGVGPGDSVLALSSPSFDMSVYEFLGVPGAGGTVVLPEPELARDPAHWAELVTEHGITVWNSAPALLKLFLDQVEGAVEDPPASLRLAILGGDWVPVTLPDRLRALAPGLEFVVLGGATEASIHSIVYPVGEVDPAWASIPYGRPMANQTAYILDAHGEPVPVGVPGELHLGGIGVGLGYLGRPELTAEKFVKWRGKRLYRTGDRARWRPDGVIELLGRIDFMVKVNGVRIEPGEVEAVLRSHPAVAEAVVVAKNDAAGDRQLVGYLVADSAVDPEEVRAHARGVLPQGMVPSRLVVLDALPLSPNGKVDRRALTDRVDDRARAVHSPPDGPTETRVARAWGSVLGLEVIDRNGDFFALGGDSFKAVRAARLLDDGLSVVSIFKHPTVAALAAHLDEGGARDDRFLHLLSPTADAPLTLVCVPYGGGNAVAYQPLADALGTSAALWAVDLPGHDLSDARPLAGIEEAMPACAAEVRERITGPVALYGQCAGTAATLLLGRALEDLGVEVTATFMGAAIPDPDPEAAWRLLTESDQDDLHAHMRRLGGFDGALADDDVTAILRVVRHDLTEMVALYRKEAGTPPVTLTGPVHCLVGDDDPATEGYPERYADWGRYGAGASLSVIAGGGHYFCKHRPGEVAEVVTRLLGGAR